MPKAPNRGNRTECREPPLETRLHARNDHGICAARMRTVTKHDIP